MHNLLDFLYKYNHWLVFAMLETVCFVLLFSYNSYQGGAWLSSANYVNGKALEAASGIEAFFSMAKVNEELTQRNLYLEQQVEAMAAAAHSDSAEAAAAVRATQAAALDNIRLIPAKVVGNSVNKRDNLITIDKGESDGVREDMGVACGSGVVGIVYKAAAHYSVVIPILHSRSTISCAIQGRGYFGHLHWTGGDPRLAYLDDVPRHARMKLYDGVVTSGYSSVFPPGIRVGKVIHVYNSPDGLSYRMQVELSTDFSRLRDVCVIDNAQALQRVATLRAAEDSLRTGQDQ